MPRYLSDAGKRLTEARYGFGDPFVAVTVKMVYAATTQKLAATEHNPATTCGDPTDAT